MMRAMKRHAIIALAALYTLSLLLPFAVSYPSVALAASETSASSASIAARIPICTAYGIVWIDADMLEEGDAPAAPMGSFQCGVCVLAAAHLDDVVAQHVASLDAPGDAYLAAPKPWRVLLPPAHRRFSVPESRAPPVDAHA